MLLAAAPARADDEAAALVRRADETTYLPAKAGLESAQCLATYVMTNGTTRRMAYSFDAHANPPSRVDPLLDPGEKPWQDEVDGYLEWVDALIWRDWTSRLEGCSFTLRRDADGPVVVVAHPRDSWASGIDELTFLAAGPVERFGPTQKAVERSVGVRTTLRYTREGDLHVPRSGTLEGYGEGFARYEWSRERGRLVPSRSTVNCAGLGGTMTFTEWRIDEGIAPVRGRADESDAQLAADLASADSEVRLRAVGHLERRGVAAASAASVQLVRLVQEIADAREEHRGARRALLVRSTLLALALCGENARDAVRPLVTLLDDVDPNMRESAAHCLGAIGSAASQAAPELADRLDTNPAALQALVLLGEGIAPAVPKLASMLAPPWPEKGPDPVRTRWVVEALARSGTAAQEALPSLVRLLDAKCYTPHLPRGFAVRDFREAAAQLLATMGPPAADALTERLLEPAVEVSDHVAGHALAAMGDAVAGPVATFVHALDAEDAGRRTRAIHALRSIGSAAASATPHLLRVLREDPDERRRGHAAWALGWVASGDEPAARAVVEAWRDGRVRGETLAVPSRRVWLDDTMFGFGATAVAPLVDVVRALRDDPRGVECALLLGHCNKSAVAALSDLADGPDATIAVRAIRGLGVVIGDAATPKLVALLSSPDEARAAAAVDALVVNSFPASRALQAFLKERRAEGDDPARDRAREALRRIAAK